VVVVSVHIAILRDTKHRYARDAVLYSFNLARGLYIHSEIPCSIFVWEKELANCLGVRWDERDQAALIRVPNIRPCPIIIGAMHFAKSLRHE
jgi:hypothetical protein